MPYSILFAFENVSNVFFLKNPWLFIANIQFYSILAKVDIGYSVQRPEKNV